MKQLLVLRHAKSSWGDSSLADFERPLSARGIADAPRVGEHLRAQSIVPDLIITSDALRARTTAKAVAEAAGYERDLVIEPSLYLANPDAIIAILNTLADDPAAIVMIVGHNPGLEELIERLTGEQHEMPTAALMDLALPIDRWGDLNASTSATVNGYWCPKG